MWGICCQCQLRAATRVCPKLISWTWSGVNVNNRWLACALFCSSRIPLAITLYLYMINTMSTKEPC